MTKNSRLKTPYYRTLNRNIILTIVSVSVIPLILVSSTIYLQYRSSYHEKVYAHLQELVHKHTQNIDSTSFPESHLQLVIFSWRIIITA